MSIFRKKIDDISIDDVEAFISEKHPENIRLEYKSGFSSSDVNQQIAKEVSAFANQQGGVLIYGITEELGKTRKPDVIVGIDKSLSPRQKIQSVCLDHIYPPIVPEIQECELKTDASKVVVVVRVDISDEAPHTINQKTGFYIRVQDRSDPREMNVDEMELLWNRREKLIERREWLLARAYERVLPSGVKRVHMLTPLIFRAIPLFPLQSLIERTRLYEIYQASIVPGSHEFPLIIDDIKTSSESIFSHFVAQEKDVHPERAVYGELNTFGQVSRFENAIYSWQEMTGIFIGLELRNLLFMMKFLTKWYKNLGYWGIVKFILDLENCKGVKFYYPRYGHGFQEQLKTLHLDMNMRIERQLSVSDLWENPEAIVVDVFQELLWGCGLSVHNASNLPVAAWINEEKKQAGMTTCPKCQGQNISVIDEVCKDCRNKVL